MIRIKKNIIIFLIPLFFLNSFAHSVEQETPQRATPIYKNKNIQKTSPETDRDETASKTQDAQNSSSPDNAIAIPNPSITTDKTTEKSSENKDSTVKKVPPESQSKPETETPEIIDEKNDSNKPKPSVNFPKKQETVEEKYKLPNVSSDEIDTIKSTSNNLSSPKTNIFENILKPIIAWCLIFTGIVLIILVIFKNRKVSKDFDANYTNMKRAKKRKKYSYNKRSKF